MSSLSFDYMGGIPNTTKYKDGLYIHVVGKEFLLLLNASSGPRPSQRYPFKRRKNSFSTVRNVGDNRVSGLNVVYG